MDDRKCFGCGIELERKQRKWCANAECKKKASRTAWILKTYGLSPEEYEAIWEYQGRKCGICGREPRKGETFHIDHEHSKDRGGPVRGICCPYCNTRLIGRLKSAAKAQALADYLHTPPATAALGSEVWAPGRPAKKRQPRKRER